LGGKRQTDRKRLGGRVRPPGGFTRGALRVGERGEKKEKEVVFLKGRREAISMATETEVISCSY